MATYNGTSGNDSITGSTGDDTVTSGAGSDTVNAGAGNDTVWLADGNDVADGGTGNDALSGEMGNDTLVGAAGFDTLVGGQGTDSLSGGADDDLVIGDGQWYVLTPSTGGTATNLTVTNQADGPIYLNTIDSTGQTTYYATIQAGQSLTVTTRVGDNWVLRDEDNHYLQEIIGATNQTYVYGPPMADTLDGGAGNDSLYGQYGNDTLIGGTGSDAVYGGAGSDVIQIGSADGIDTITGGETTGDADNLSFGTAVGGVSVTFSGAEAGSYSFAGGGSGSFSQIEKITGTTAADRLNAGASTSPQTIVADAGNDTITGGTGNDSIDAGTGNDTVSGGSGSDTVSLGSGDDTFGDWSTEGGNDLVYGGDGNDSVIGGGENDVIYGDAGNDTLAGGAGTDSLFGGADADVFTITDDHNYDSIDGGETGTDWDTIWYSNWASSLGINVTFSGTGSGSYGYVGTTGTGAFNGIEAVGGTVYADNLNASADGGGVTLYGNAGNDTITGGSGSDVLDGGTGNDSLSGGAGADSLTGGAGNDTLTGGTGNDTLAGGNDNDVIAIGSGDGIDTIIGGETGTDFDTLQFSTATTTGVSVSFTANEAGSYLFGAGNSGGFQHVEAVSGTAQADALDASKTTNAVTLSGSAGNDTITGGSGSDVLDGGTGNDSLSGGAGADSLTGGAGADTLTGGTGNDTLSGGDDADTFLINPGDGVDGITGGEAGSDWDSLTFGGVTSGAGVTVTFSGAEAGSYVVAGGGSGSFTEVETFAGTAGADVFDASAATGATGPNLSMGDGADTFIGGSGADYVLGGNGNDSLTGNGGNDTIDGGDGADILAGGDGDDMLLSGLGDDTVTGGTGNDYVSAWLGNDSLDGGAGNDSIIGGDGSDTLIGGAGNDSLDGGGDADRFVLATGWGADTVSGGETGLDSDTLDLSGVSGGLSIVMTGSEAGTATDGISKLSFSGIETVVGGAGADAINAAAASAPVAIQSGAGNDTVSGGSGADSIDGGDGEDLLSGGGGADSLAGGAGSDRLTGGAGNDTLSGGSGNDVFTLTVGGGLDRITDFDRGDSDADGHTNDLLDVTALRDAAGGAVTRGDVTIGSDAQGNAVLTFPGGEQVVLQGITATVAAAQGQLFAMGIPCFAKGTLIATPDGAVRVEDITAGMLVMTRDHGAQPVIWAGGRRIGRRQLSDRPELRPIVIPPGPLGNRRALTVSPQHAVLLRRRRDDTGQFVRARHLAARGDGMAHVAEAAHGVAYHHLLFRQHEVIWAEGVETESFYPGRFAMMALGRRAQAEIRSLLCDKAGIAKCSGDIATCYGPRARPLLGRKDAMQFKMVCPLLAEPWVSGLADAEPAVARSSPESHRSGLGQMPQNGSIRMRLLKASSNQWSGHWCLDGAEKAVAMWMRVSFSR